MELTKDVVLRGDAWVKATDKLAPIFKTRPHYMIFMLAMSIGIMYDQKVVQTKRKKSVVMFCRTTTMVDSILCSRQQYCLLLRKSLLRKNGWIWPLAKKPTSIKWDS